MQKRRGGPRVPGASGLEIHHVSARCTLTAYWDLHGLFCPGANHDDAKWDQQRTHLCQLTLHYFGQVPLQMLPGHSVLLPFVLFNEEDQSRGSEF